MWFYFALHLLGALAFGYLGATFADKFASVVGATWRTALVSVLYWTMAIAVAIKLMLEVNAMQVIKFSDFSWTQTLVVGGISLVVGTVAFLLSFYVMFYADKPKGPTR